MLNSLLKMKSSFTFRKMRAGIWGMHSNGLIYLSCLTLVAMEMTTVLGQPLLQPSRHIIKPSCCGDGYGLNYSLPMFDVCRKTQHEGSMVQTIPKLIPASPAQDTRCRRQNKLDIPLGQRICRIPDCMKEPCPYGLCEETMTGYICHFTGATNNSSLPQTTNTTEATESPTTEIDRLTSPLFEPVVRCPEGWLEGKTSNKCYYVVPSPFWGTWYEARDVCGDMNVTTSHGMNVTTSHGMNVTRPQLLVLESVDEMLELKQIVIDSFVDWWRNIDYVWLNCNDMRDEGTFYCDDVNGESTPMQYSDWRFGYPLGDRRNYPRDCVMTYYYWPLLWTMEDNYCEYARAGAICEIHVITSQEHPTPQNMLQQGTIEPVQSTTNSTMTSTSDIHGRCPEGWLEGKTNNKCYNVMNVGRGHSDTWYQARDVCAYMNVTTPNRMNVTHPQLLVLESVEEMVELKQIVIDSSTWWWWWYDRTSGVWLNCNDMRDEGTFLCESNGETVPMKYTNWDDGKPNDNITDNRPEDCVVIVDAWPFIWTLDDTRCDGYGWTICELSHFGD